MIAFDFSGLVLRVTGLPPDQETRWAARWPAFATEPSADPWLDVRVTTTPARARRRGVEAKEMSAEPDGAATRWVMAGGTARVHPGGPVELAAEDGEGDDTIFIVVNLLHAAIASRLAAGGGAFLHAAGVIFEGRAFVLPGAEGAGKSTWARAALGAGASVLSDDIVLVAPEGAGFVALGAPLRAKDFGGGQRGRWPLAAILLPRHGDQVAVEPAASLFAQAALTANLPFVIDDPACRPAADAVVARLAAAVPARTLVFTRDDAGLGAIAETLP